MLSLSKHGPSSSSAASACPISSACSVRASSARGPWPWTCSPTAPATMPRIAVPIKLVMVLSRPSTNSVAPIDQATPASKGINSTKVHCN